LTLNTTNLTTQIQHPNNVHYTANTHVPHWATSVNTCCINHLSGCGENCRAMKWIHQHQQIASKK